MSLEPTTCKEAEPFALQVRDDSMSPEFWPGCVIIVDPTGHATDGAFVLGEIGGRLLFRELKRTEEKLLLRPLNPSYDIVELGSIAAVKGVVVQRAGTRRRHHKRYDLRLAPRHS